MGYGVCLSVPCLNITQERKGLGSPLAELKLITRVTREPIYRSKVKVTRPINVHRVNAQYLPNGKACVVQLSTQTEHEDPHHQ